VSSLEPTDGAKSAGEIGGAESGRRRGNDSLQADPRVARSWNSYAYAGNSPVSNVDPTGLLPVDWDMGGPGPNTGGGAGGGGGGIEGGGLWGVPGWMWADAGGG
jgi:hypothetical protein